MKIDISFDSILEAACRKQWQQLIFQMIRSPQIGALRHIITENMSVRGISGDWSGMNLRSILCYSRNSNSDDFCNILMGHGIHATHAVFNGRGFLKCISLTMLKLQIPV